MRDRLSRDKDLMPYWGDVPLIDITKGSVKAWATRLRNQGMAPATVQKRVYLLSASLTAAVDHEVLDFNPARGVRVDKAVVDRRRYLTDAEVEMLLAQFRPPVAEWMNEVLVLSLIGTGMRWGELIGLQIHNVDFTRGIITVADTWDDKGKRLVPYPKGKRDRQIPMLDWLASAVRLAIGNRSAGFVFLKDGRFVFDYQNWRREVWLPATQRAGLKGTRIHDLRHTFASYMLQHGASLAEVGAMLGHRSPQTTQIYAKVAHEFSTHVKASMPKLNV